MDVSGGLLRSIAPDETRQSVHNQLWKAGSAGGEKYPFSLDQRFAINAPGDAPLAAGDDAFNSPIYRFRFRFGFAPISEDHVCRGGIGDKREVLPWYIRWVKDDPAGNTVKLDQHRGSRELIDCRNNYRPSTQTEYLVVRKIFSGLPKFTPFFYCSIADGYACEQVTIGDEGAPERSWSI